MDYAFFILVVFMLSTVVFWVFFVTAIKKIIIADKQKDENENNNQLKDNNFNVNSDVLKLDNKYIGDIDVDIKRYFPDKDEKTLIEEFFNTFVDVHKALMLFDYDTLKNKCSDELYSSYKSDLKVYKMRKQQMITNDYKLISSNIKEIIKDDKCIIIKVFFHVSYRKYIVDTNKKVIIGDDYEYIHDQYNLEYIISTNEIKCPNCGSIIKDNEKKCSYCNSPINSNYNSFVLNVLSKL